MHEKSESLAVNLDALEDEEEPGRTRQTVIAIVVMLGYQGFAMAINGVAAPWIERSFGLDQAGIARLFACISPAALGALLLSRLVDRFGRRRVLLWCMGATPMCALAAALSTSIVLFVAFEILLYAFIGATVSASVVMLAEELPIAYRSTGQSYAGLAMGLGGGLCLLLMPLLDRGGYSWRWLLALAATGIGVLPFVARVTPESQRWQRAFASGATTRTTFTDVFRAPHGRRAVPMLICTLLSQITGTAATSWSYFHAVTVVGLSATATSLMMVLGGGVGLLGFPLGAWAAERFGRVPTVVTCGIVGTAGISFFYWGPPATVALHALWLGASFAWFTSAGNAVMVGGNSTATELFPTALRGTMIGWFTLIGAAGAIVAQASIAMLAGPLGGLSTVVGYLGLLGIPSAIIFGLYIDETRGLSLEVAAQERT